MTRLRSTTTRARRIAVLAGVALALVAPPGLFDASLAAAQGRGNPFRGRRLYVDAGSPARKQASEWERSRPADAAHMRRMAEQPQSIWLGGWNRDVRNDVDRYLAQAGGAMPVFVVYNIPYRDCGLYSRGGASDADNYRRWVIEIARGVRNRPAAFIVEPDGAAAGDCLPALAREERYVLLREAVDVLKKTGAAVYVDAGNAAWKRPAEMAERLKKAGIELADGFALNVSNFQSTASTITYGNSLSRLVGGAHYVIDTSRNGRGATGQRQWCNPSGMALGAFPTTDTQAPLADAYLWIKTPGQSDGTCNGGPRAGEWWPDYALGLSRTAETLGSAAGR